MPFAADRDLLALEPSLFRDVAWSGQRLLSGAALIESGTLKFSSSDIGADAAGISPGCVALVGATPYEVLEVLSGTELTISILRSSETADQVLMPDNGVAVAATIHTFAPQIEIVHRQCLRMLGIEPTSNAAPTASDITNPAAMRRLEALGALHLIFSAAGALTPATSPLNTRAELYRQRFNQERERISIGLDLNADGLPDAIRKLNVVQFVRG